MRMFRLGPLLVAITLFACSPPTQQSLSIEDAKKITAEFKSEPLVAPPRRSDDLVALLDRVEPDAKLAESKRTASSEPAADLAPLQLAAFLRKRGDARFLVGRSAEAITDLRQALDIARSNGASPLTQWGYMSDLEWFLRSAGSLRAALDIWQQRKSITPANRQDLIVGIHAASTVYRIAVGDLDAAEQSLEVLKTTADAIIARSPRDPWVPERLRLYYGAKGYLAGVRGQYQEAEEARRSELANISEVVRRYPTLPRDGTTPAIEYFADERDRTRTDLARILALQGRYSEAEAEAREALVQRLKSAGRASESVARAALALAEILGQEVRNAEAERLAAAAIRILRNAGYDSSAPNVIGARLELGKYQERQGKQAVAFVTYEAISADLAGEPERQRGALGQNITFAFVNLSAGRRDRVLPILEAAYVANRERVGDGHVATAESQGLLAVAQRDLGHRDEAAANFRAALATLTANPIAGIAGNRRRVLNIILLGYLHLLTDGETEGAVPGATIDEAFRLADLARAQGLQQSLAGAVARMQIGDPILADLARREQDATQQVAARDALLVNVLGRASGERDDQVIARLRAEIQRIALARDTLRSEIERRFPSYAALINPSPPSIAGAQAALRPGEALISTLALDDRLLIWAVPKSGPPAFAVVRVGSAELGRMIAQLRLGVAPPVATLGEVPAFDVALARKLYLLLLEPVKSGWRGANTLVVAGPPVTVPWELLVTRDAAQPVDQAGQPLFSGYRNVPFLARDVAVARLPSAAALPVLRAAPAGDARRRPFVGFGDPWFTDQQTAEAGSVTNGDPQPALGFRGFQLRAPPATQNLASAGLAALPRLPETADEIRAVGGALGADPRTDLFLGAAANERQVRSMRLDDRRVVMFATHGLVPGDLDGLTQPALALSSPKVTGGEGDGLLTMEKVLGLKLDADWVVLSACNTATGESRGAEAFSGLGRAFFYAGARALLVTNWPVETTSARLLTAEIFQRQAADPTLSRAQALRRAELALVDGPGLVDEATGKTMFSYAHPLFWAPYSLLGDGS